MQIKSRKSKNIYATKYMYVMDAHACVILTACTRNIINNSKWSRVRTEDLNTWSRVGTEDMNTCTNRRLEHVVTCWNRRHEHVYKQKTWTRGHMLEQKTWTHDHVSKKIGDVHDDFWFERVRANGTDCSQSAVFAHDKCEEQLLQGSTWLVLWLVLKTLCCFYVRVLVHDKCEEQLLQGSTG